MIKTYIIKIQSRNLLEEKLSVNESVESEIFAIFMVEVTKTSFTTNCDHSKNYVRSMRNLEHWLYKNQVK